MQKNIHPDYHEITVIMTDGSKFTTKSTYGKAGQELKLDIDPLTHPAWIGGKTFLNENVSKVAKFKERFGSIDFSKTSAKKEDK
jgi:large subunit ribosomal protein L31